LLSLIKGVVFSEIKEASRGQGFRDRVRCEALETCGYNVYSLDNKHDESLAKEGIIIAKIIIIIIIIIIIRKTLSS